MRAFALTCLALLAGTGYCSQTESAKARQLIQQAMKRRSSVNVRAIIVQRADYTSNVMQQIKVEMSRDGKIHQTVVAPLSMQNYESVDDGKTWMRFSPDDRSVVIQSAPRQDDQDIRFRMALVDRNYDLKVERKDKIAGRIAWVIAAVPKNSELETRCYSIDEKSGFLLRLETCREGSAPMTHLDTKLVEFPQDLPADVFRLNATMVKSTRRYEASLIKPTAQNMGFKPLVPSALPFGFAVQELQADTSSRLPSCAVRLTDGLASATVYQWRGSGQTAPPAPAGTRVRTVGTLRVLISGDLPTAVKDRLLDAFVRSSRDRALDLPSMALAWLQELSKGGDALTLDGAPIDLIIVDPMQTLVRL